MNLFELFVRIGVDDQASGKISKIAQGLGNGLKTAAKIGVAAVGAASTAIVALGKIGLEYNSQMEQYTTNFTTMLGSQEAAVKKVEELKKFAASTPLSMDDLAKGTQTLLAFGVESENSTGILRQLGDIALGDADKMQRLSTAFGKATAAGKVTGDTVQQMIDAGWNPLIQISKAAGETMEETQKRMSAGAISVEELQAAMEAVTSGTGQFAGGMEAASHTMQGMISTLKDNANALVGEVFMPISEGLIGDVLPGAIEAVSSLTTAFRENGISGMIEAAGGIVGGVIGELTNALPNFTNTAIEIVKSINQGILDNLPTIIESAIEFVNVLANGILGMLPEIIKLGLDLIVSLANGIAGSIPELIPIIVDVVLQIVDTLTSNVGMLVNAAISIMLGLADGLIKSIPKIVAAIPKIIENLIQAIIGAIPQIIEAGIQLFVSLIANLPEIIVGIVAAIPEIIMAILDGLASLGGQLADLFSSAWEGIKGVFSDVGGWFQDKFQEGKEKANQAWSDAKSLFSQNWENVKAGYGAVGDWFSETFEKGKEEAANSWSNAKEVFSDIWNKIEDVFSKGKEIGRKIIDDIKKGIAAAWENLKTWFNNLWDSLFGSRSVDVNVNKNYNGGAEPPKPHANGLPYVPYDGYYALLHEGERVLTAKENKAYSNGQTGNTSGITIIQNIQSVPQTPVELAAATSAYFEQARWAF